MRKLKFGHGFSRKLNVCARAEALRKIVRKQNRITKPRHKGLRHYSFVANPLKPSHYSRGDYGALCGGFKVLNTFKILDLDTAILEICALDVQKLPLLGTAWQAWGVLAALAALGGLALCNRRLLTSYECSWRRLRVLYKLCDGRLTVASRFKRRSK